MICLGFRPMVVARRIGADRLSVVGRGYRRITFWSVTALGAGLTAWLGVISGVG